MKKVTVFTNEGEKKGQISLPKEVFDVQVRPSLLAQAVRVYLANQRKAKAKVKTRGEVVGSRRKIWRQKGTGQARHGDRYAPIFVGGGVAHGPTGEENFKLEMSRKMKRKALFGALTDKLEKDEILVLEGLEKLEPKTKKLAFLFKKIIGERKKILLILPEKIEGIIRAARNISNVSLAQARLLNTYEVLNGGRLVFLPESIKVLKENYFKQDKSEKTKTKKEA